MHVKMTTCANEVALQGCGQCLNLCCLDHRLKGSAFGGNRKASEVETEGEVENAVLNLTVVNTPGPVGTEEIAQHATA